MLKFYRQVQHSNDKNLSFTCRTRQLINEASGIFHLCHQEEKVQVFRGLISVKSADVLRPHIGDINPEGT
jgi:hypothetical protein